MKSITTITLDSTVIAELRLRKVNISKTINDYLKSFLQITNSEAVKDENLKSEILVAEAKLQDLKAKQDMVEREAERKKKEQEEINQLSMSEKLKRGLSVEF